MARVLNVDHAIAAVLNGARIVKLSDREREVARIPAGHELVAETPAAAERLRRLIAIRAEQEADLDIRHR